MMLRIGLLLFLLLMVCIQVFPSNVAKSDAQTATKGNTKLTFPAQFSQAAESAPIGWNETYGGPFDDRAYSAVQTEDGGYAIAGYTKSFGAGGPYFYYADAFLVKLDAYGNLQWNKTYGGTGYDRANSLVQTSDEGYALAGMTVDAINLNDIHTYVVKTDVNGTLEWQKTYPIGNGATAIVQASDGGYIVAGSFWSFRTDSSGTMIWNKTYGSATLSSMVQTNDGGYALMSTGFWLVKSDRNGNMQWNHTCSSEGTCNSMIQTQDGGYLMVGYRDMGWWAPGARFDTDFYLVKTDAQGIVQWNTTYGTTDVSRRFGYEQANSVVQEQDGIFAVVGKVTPYGSDYGEAPFGNALFMRFDGGGNPYGENRIFAGSGDQYFQSIINTKDGGLLLVGNAAAVDSSIYDFYVVKTDSYGDIPELSPSIAPLSFMIATIIAVIVIHMHRRARTRKVSSPC